MKYEVLWIVKMFDSLMIVLRGKKKRRVEVGETSILPKGSKTILYNLLTADLFH